MMWTVYLLHVASVVVPAAGKPGSRDTYVGMTNRLEFRIKMHNAGKVSATHGRQWKIVAWIPCANRETASQLERWLKCGDTRRKRQLMALNAEASKRVIPAIERELLDAVDLWQIKRDHKLAVMLRDQPRLSAVVCREKKTPDE